MRRGAIAASVMLSLSGLLYCGGAVLDAWQMKGETENTVAKVAQVEQRHAAVLATLPPMRFSPKVIRETVEIDARLSGSGYHPQFMMTLLGKTLSRFPDIQLDEIRWKIIKPEEQLQDEEGTEADAFDTGRLACDVRWNRTGGVLRAHCGLCEPHSAGR